MKAQRDEAFVLQTQELGEADLIVTLLARDHGKVRGVARSARRSRRRYGGALEPMTEVHAAWSEKAGRELHRIEQLDARRSFAEMQADPARQAACAVLAEISSALAQEGQPDPQAYRLLGATLSAMEGGLDVWIAVRYFEYWMLRVHGLLAELEACAECGSDVAGDGPVWATRGGSLRCQRCAEAAGEGSRRLAAAGRRFLDSARKQPPQSVIDPGSAAGPGGPLEWLLRGALEAYAERRFRTYRHLRAAARSQERR